jgi:hypothetical protein
MSFKSSGQDQDRFDQIVELKQDTFCYEPLREAIAEVLYGDEQFRVLLVLSEQSRQFVAARDSQVGCNSSMRNSIAGFGETLDEALHRRADEIITELCASYLRQDDRWLVDDPDSLDMTDIQAGEDATNRARQWLNDHGDIVTQHNITYPEDE